MAVTLEGAKLTAAHRKAQLALQREVARELMAVWPLLDPADLDATFPRYFRAALAVVANRKRQSASVAAAYLRAFREAEGVFGAFDVDIAADVLEQQALTALLVTGPVQAKTLIAKGHAADAAMRRSLGSSTGAASRLTAQGGRDTIIRTVKIDDRALGVARVARSGSCAFCAMLASRGPVYGSEATAGFEAHDNCGCVPEVVYDRNRYDWPGGDRQLDLADLWDDATKGRSGKDAVRAFRRAYEDRQRRGQLPS